MPAVLVIRYTRRSFTAGAGTCSVSTGRNGDSSVGCCTEDHPLCLFVDFGDGLWPRLAGARVEYRGVLAVVSTPTICPGKPPSVQRHGVALNPGFPGVVPEPHPGKSRLEPSQRPRVRDDG